MCSESMLTETQGKHIQNTTWLSKCKPVHQPITVTLQVALKTDILHIEEALQHDASVMFRIIFCGRLVPLHVAGSILIQ